MVTIQDLKFSANSEQATATYQLVCDLEAELLEWKKKLEECTWKKGSRRRPAMIYVINRILGEEGSE